MFHVPRRNGFASLTLILLIFAVSTFVISLTIISVWRNAAIVRNARFASASVATAESGLEDLLYRNKFARNFDPVETLTLNGGTASVASANTGNEASITSTGFVENRVRSLNASLIKNTSDVQFHYGVQVGDGGLVMMNNAQILGNVYSNGNIDGGMTGSKISGSAWVAGGTQPSPDVSWTVTSADFAFGRRVGNDDRFDVAQGFKTSTTAPVNRVSLYLKKVGLPADVAVQINEDNGGEPGKTNNDIVAQGTLPAQLVTGSYGWVQVSFTSAPILTAGTQYWLLIDGIRNDTNYWISGIDASDAYGNGTAKWTDSWNTGNPSWTAAGGDFSFKVWMGGVNTHIDSITIGGDAHAHLITKSTVTSSVFSAIFKDSKADGDVAADVIQDCSGPIKGDASYNAMQNCTVNGTTTSPAVVPADPPPMNFPVSDGQILQWQKEAADGGTFIGDYVPLSSTSYGPKVITGDLVLDNSVVLTLTGTIYVQGTITFSNLARLQLDPSYGSLSGVIMSNGRVIVNNNASFGGSGVAGSYVMVLSSSVCRGVSAPGCDGPLYAAVDLSNNTVGAIFYAPNGIIQIANGVSATEITAYQIHMSPGASIAYQQGLANAQFSSGPGASWEMTRWREVE